MLHYQSINLDYPKLGMINFVREHKSAMVIYALVVHHGHGKTWSLVKGSFVEKLRVTESEHHHHTTKIIVSSRHVLNIIITKQRSLCEVGTC